MQPADLIGQTLGHYQLQQQVGYGGMATVFLARDIHLDREVAVKVFWPRPGETQDFLRRFSREARVLAQLDHPNILPVYDYGEQGELAFLITPYMPGGTLKDLLKERKVLPPSEAIALISQVLPALQYAHERNLIHRDIKPANLLFKGDGSVVLADFGLVKVIEGEGRAGTPLHTVSETGQSTAGTPEYMAPEQIEGHPVAASDIYAVGVVLYEMVTGSRPFTGDSVLTILMKHLHEVPPSPRTRNPYVSPQLEAAILRAMEKDWHRRFAHPADLRQALQQINNPSSNPGLTGLANNPSSNPGFARPGSNPSSNPNMQPSVLHNTAGEYNPTVATGWNAGPPQQAAGAMQTGAQGYTSGSTVQNSLPPDAFAPNTPARTGAWQQQASPMSQQGSGPATPFPPAQPWMMNQATPLPSAPRRRRRSRTPAVVLTLLFVLLAGVVAALFLTPIGSALFHPGPQTTATATSIVGGNTPGAGGSTPPVRGEHTATPGSTQAMPPTSTNCPASGTARAAVIAPLALGTNATIAYIVNEVDNNGNATFGTIKIYNTVTGKKTELTRASTTSITSAQVSNDGQWVLFSAAVASHSELRLVRLDGQGLQTLLCMPAGATISSPQWSIDQKYVIFDGHPSVSGGGPTVYLLNTSSGALQVEVAGPTSGMALMPRTWLDLHRVLMIGIVPNSDAPPQNVYVLDINNGPNQSVSSATQIYASGSQTCWDFDSSYDARTLFIAQCTQGQPYGSGTITQQPVSGGGATTIINSPSIAFDTVRVINAQGTSLLAIASDTGLGTASGDPAHDGLYLIKTDGSPPQLLNGTPLGQFKSLNGSSQYFWSNVSRDQKMYALETASGSANTYTLSFGRLSGGTPTTFASIAHTELAIAGWTTT